MTRVEEAFARVNVRHQFSQPIQDSVNISTNSGSYFYVCILQMRVWGINQPCHHFTDTLLVFSTSRLCAHLAFAVLKFSHQLTKYLAVCQQTICCVSLIHRSSQSQRNRQKSPFRQVQQLLCTSCWYGPDMSNWSITCSQQPSRKHFQQ